MNIKGRSVIVLAVSFLVILAGAAVAEEKISGTVRSIDLNNRTIIVKAYNGPEVAIYISDDDFVTMNKFLQAVIKVDDEVRVEYVVREGRNVATSFKKSAGCRRKAQISMPS